MKMFLSPLKLWLQPLTDLHLTLPEAATCFHLEA